MIARPKASEIDPQDPFVGDLFQRKELATGLIKLLTRTQGPLTIALTSPFGGGKTYFLARCRQMLEANQVPVVMLNAWETDFAQEPIAPLIAEFTAAFGSRLPNIKKATKSLKSLAAKITAAAVPVGIRLLTAGLLKADDFTEGAIADAAQKAAEKQFEQFEAARGSISHLREQLSVLANEIRPDANPRPPVVIIIDELDRCRPTYAIELLEVVKHLFSIPGIVFLLGIDRAQLSASARAVFGQDTDTDGYLRRFIDLECSLPNPNIANYCENFGLSFIQDVTGNAPISFQGMLARATGQLCRDAGFSIRKTQQFLTRYGVAAIAAGADEVNSDTIALLTFINMHDEELYRRFVWLPGSAQETYQTIRSRSPSFLNYEETTTYVPFLFPLAVKGHSDTPISFLRDFRGKLVQEDARHNACENLASFVGRYSSSYFERMARFVEFGAAFIAR